jgi:outer membrane protein OmpA-like peptidoglycan-associated protein
MVVPAEPPRIQVPRYPKSYRGPMQATVALGTSYRGVPAVPIPQLTTGLTVGMAATLSDNGLFAFDSARLTVQGRAQVRSLARFLGSARTVRCEGYTDYAGRARHEKSLSQRRARAVCRALRAAGARVRIVTKGYGGTRPAVVGGTPYERALNRRVVVVVTV